MRFRGLQDCVLLVGIEHADPTSAFSTISERNHKRIIVDNSKRIEFTRHFIGRPDRDLKVVHLVKDPMSRWASLRRREPCDLDRYMDDWWTENNEIRQFTAAPKIHTITVAYDIVAADSELELPAIFEFFGSSLFPKRSAILGSRPSWLCSEWRQQLYHQASEL